MNKKVLRELYLEKRKTLTPQEFDRRSQLVFSQTIDFLKTAEGSHIHLFLPIVHNKEVNTWPILDFLLESEKHTPIVSSTDFRTKKMAHYLINNDTHFKNDSYGIPSPIGAEEISIDKIDLVLTPLISFDLAGNRIGYGGGYYDTFLSKCRKDVKVIGLAITSSLDLITYAEPHDHKMNMCINHNRMFKF